MSSDDKRIKKDQRKALEEIENICGVRFKRVQWRTNEYSIQMDNLFNFNDEGLIIMLGLDLNKIDLDENKLDSLGEPIRQFNDLERFLLTIPEDKQLPKWLKDLNYIMV